LIPMKNYNKFGFDSEKVITFSDFIPRMLGFLGIMEFFFSRKYR
jgi:nitrate reductase assembly molybdenum cofactor insertion protein NarJ